MSVEINKDQIALGIKQPWAELILQEKKRLEIRSQSTNVRGPIYLYTSRKIATEDFATEALKNHSLDKQSLPLGLIVGQIEIVDSRPVTTTDEKFSLVPIAVMQGKYAWELAHPVRFTEPIPVRFLPYGVWFYPFQRRKG